MKTYNGTIFGILGLAIIAAFMVGWCINAYKLCKLDFASPYKAELIRGVGVVMPPLGSILGLFVTFNEEVK